MPGGRPEIYTQDLADRICDQLADGDSLRTVCKEKWAPSKQTVFKWMRTNAEFLSQYARAKQEAADAFIEEMQDIADDGSNDWMLSNKPNNPGWVENGEAMQRSRLRVDTRKWIASKLKPKKYGDKLELASDPTSPFVVQVVKYADDTSTK